MLKVSWLKSGSSHASLWPKKTCSVLATEKSKCTNKVAADSQMWNIFTRRWGVSGFQIRRKELFPLILSTRAQTKHFWGLKRHCIQGCTWPCRRAKQEAGSFMSLRFWHNRKLRFLSEDCGKWYHLVCFLLLLQKETENNDCFKKRTEVV